MPSGGGAGVGPAMKVMQLTLKERVTIDRLTRLKKDGNKSRPGNATCRRSRPAMEQKKATLNRNVSISFSNAP